MIKIHKGIEQGSDEWFELRRGILTASKMNHILSPSRLEFSSGSDCKAHAFEIAAQRVSGFVEPEYMSGDMFRGKVDEPMARELYRQHYGDVEEVAFITNDDYGFMLGYSPDGIVGDKGGIEIKSRKQSLHVRTMLENAVPRDHVLQCQTAMFVAGWDWIDYVSYCAGLPIWIIRVEKDPIVQTAIYHAATAFDNQVNKIVDDYNAILKTNKIINTDRQIEVEIIV
jgi:putative phage-type endonuclease